MAEDVKENIGQAKVAVIGVGGGGSGGGILLLIIYNNPILFNFKKYIYNK